MSKPLNPSTPRTTPVAAPSPAPPPKTAAVAAPTAPKTEAPAFRVVDCHVSLLREGGGGGGAEVFIKLTCGLSTSAPRVGAATRDAERIKAAIRDTLLTLPEAAEVKAARQRIIDAEDQVQALRAQLAALDDEAKRSLGDVGRLARQSAEAKGTLALLGEHIPRLRHELAARVQAFIASANQKAFAERTAWLARVQQSLAGLGGLFGLAEASECLGKIISGSVLQGSLGNSAADAQLASMVAEELSPPVPAAPPSQSVVPAGTLPMASVEMMRAGAGLNPFDSAGGIRADRRF